MVIHTIDLISVMHPYLIELICGSDMNMMLNPFCVFLYLNTPNFTRHRFLDSSFHLFLKIAKLMLIFQTAVPQYITRTEKKGKT